MKTYIKTTKEDLFNLWYNPGLLLKYASNIKNLIILKKGDHRLLTRWEVEIEKARFFWVQEDILDEPAGRITFSMQEGDFGAFKGEWRVYPLKSGLVKVEFKAYFDWGLTVLKPYVEKVLRRKTRVMGKSFLKSIKEALESYYEE